MSDTIPNSSPRITALRQGRRLETRASSGGTFLYSHSTQAADLRLCHTAARTRVSVLQGRDSAILLASYERHRQVDRPSFDTEDASLPGPQNFKIEGCPMTRRRLRQVPAVPHEDRPGSPERGPVRGSSLRTVPDQQYRACTVPKLVTSAVTWCFVASLRSWHDHGPCCFDCCI